MPVLSPLCKSRTFRESPWHINSFFRNIDRFGQPIPAFNVNGKDKVTSTVGGVLTTAIITLTLGYFLRNLSKLADGSEPTISYNVVHNYYGADKGLNF